MNWALLAANIAVGLGESFTRQFDHPTWINWFELDSRVPQVRHFITYAFVHASWWHLLGNMIALYIFGNNVNDRMGHLGYLAFYLSGAVFAGTGFVLSEAGGLPIVGASGAVMAVMGAYLALFPRSNITILSLLFFLGTFEVPSMYLIIIYFAYDLLAHLGPTSDIAHVAHIAGMLIGFGVSMGLLALKLLPRDPFDFLSLLQRRHRRRQYKELVKQGYNPFAYVPSSPAGRPQPPAHDPRLERIRDLRAEINEAVAHHNLPHAAILFLELRRLDPQQVLSRQAQLDIANQLASQQFYTQAAEAYESFLAHYPNFEQIEHVQLMVGLIYARYLHQYERGQRLLLRALDRLHGHREIEMARVELRRIMPLIEQRSENTSST
jgi:membrane associated rhomboid family serine protease